MMPAPIRFIRTRLPAWLMALACAVALPACDNERIAGTEEGLTTEAEVRAKWGPPEAVWDGAVAGEKIYEYNRQPQGTTNYMIHIGADGTVSALRQVLTRKNFDKVHAGMMMEDVRRLLGRPAKSVTYPMKNETVMEWRFREGHGGVASLFTVTYDADLRVVRTGISDDPNDITSPDRKP